MKKVIFILSVVFALYTDVSAGVYQDSLVSVIRYSKNDSMVMVANCELSKTLYKVNVDSAISLLGHSINIAITKDYQFQLGIYYKMRGVYYYSSSKYNLALSNLKESEAILSKIKDSLNLADVLFHEGVCYNEMGNYETSIDYYYKALQFFENHNDTMGIGRTLNNLGVNLEAMGEHQSAYLLYKKAYQFKKVSNDYNGIANSYMNLGNAKLNVNEFDSSLYYHKLALQAANLLRNDRLQIEALTCLGKDYLKLEKAHRAIELFEEAFNKFKNYNNNYQLSIVYNGLAKAYFLKGDNKKALTYIHYNINLLKNTGAIDLLKDAYLLHAEIRNSVGDYNEAYEAMKEYALIKDSIYNSEKLSAIAEMQEKYKTDKKQKEIDALKYEKELTKINVEKQETYLLGTVLFSIILGGFLVFVIIMFKQRNNTNQLLNQSLKEKEVLIKEVHHRVKNNFQLISSLLNLQSDLVKDEEALIAITEARNRIASMALVHKNLYMTDDLTSIEMNTYIDQLLESIISTSDKGDVKIRYNFEAERVSFDVDTSVPLGLIINELLTNSIKYAFVDREEGIVNLKIRHIDGDKYELIYSDNGVGLPEDIDLDNLSSLGLELVQLLAAQLNGDVTYKVDSGTAFKIIFNKA